MAHQAAGLHVLAHDIDGWNCMPRRQRGKLKTSGEEEQVGADQERLDAVADECRECSRDLTAGAGVDDPNLKPHGASGLSNVSRELNNNRRGWIDEHSHSSGSGDKLAQQAELLCPQFTDEEVHAGNVAAWPGEAGHKTKPDRVLADGHDDGDRRGRRLGRQRRWLSGRDQQGDVPANQFRR